jgi:P27 family predicted phage terminase small subunit
MRGRPSQPTSLKILKGEQKSRINKDEPKPALVEKDILPTIYMDESELQEFKRLSLRLSNQRILTENDIDMLSIYVRELNRYRDCQHEITKRGSTLINDKGVEYINPNSDLANRHLKNIIQISSHFGFSPSTRTKIIVGAAEKPLGIAAFKKNVV